MREAVFCGKPGKDAIRELEDEWMAKVESLRSNFQGSTLGNSDLRSNLGPKSDPEIAKRFFEDKVDEEIHRGAIEDGKRADNRAMDEIRPLFAKAGGISPILHGSGIFYRGGTHVFTALTL